MLKIAFGKKLITILLVILLAIFCTVNLFSMFISSKTQNLCTFQQYKFIIWLQSKMFNANFLIWYSVYKILSWSLLSFLIKLFHSVHLVDSKTSNSSSKPWKPPASMHPQPQRRTWGLVELIDRRKTLGDLSICRWSKAVWKSSDIFSRPEPRPIASSTRCTTRWLRSCWQLPMVTS